MYSSRRPSLHRRFGRSPLLVGAFLFLPVRGALSGEESVRDGVSAAEWGAICAAHAANRHAVFAVDGGWQASNPGQRWSTSFDGRGFEVEPDAGTAIREPAAWRWGLALESCGTAGAEQRVTVPTATRAVGHRVSYEWNGTIEEWYVNDARGLEHGFTVRERLASGADMLTLTLAVRGGLEPILAQDGRGIAFVNRDGATVVNYSGLVAFDADGHDVPARLDVIAGRIRFTIDTAGARYPLTIDPIAQQAYLKASNADAGDGFGDRVAISGDTIVVGARYESSNATGVNGDQTSNGASHSGAAYVFVRNGTTWSQQAYLKASNTEANDEFGWAVAVSGDTVVIGAYAEDSNATVVDGDQANNSANLAGAAYVFTRTGTTWSQQAYLKASNAAAADTFGRSVAVFGDTILVGAGLEDSAATGVGGDQANDGASGSGAVYVFARSGTTWSQQAYLKASNTNTGDDFGGSVAISGDTAVIGASGEDSKATGVDGNQADNSVNFAGAAYVFTRVGTVWTQQAYLKASNTGTSDYFGTSTAISGDTLVVGAASESSNATGVNGDESDNSTSNAGASYVFVRNGSTWAQQAYLKASNTGMGDAFGQSVSVSDDTIVVGAQYEDSNATGVNGDESDNSASQSGAAYVFVRSGTSWSQIAYLKSSNSGLGDGTSGAVAVSGSTIVVGAVAEDSNATGVNGDQSNNSAGNSGAAYVYDLCPSVAAATPYGTGKPGTMGIPSLSSTNAPRMNTTADLTVSGGLGGASTVLLFAGFAAQSLGFDGGTLRTTPTFIVPLPALDGGGGLSLPVPITTWACGLHVYFQVMFTDPGAAGYYHTAQTNGLDWTIGG